MHLRTVLIQHWILLNFALTDRSRLNKTPDTRTSRRRSPSYTVSLLSYYCQDVHSLYIYYFHLFQNLFLFIFSETLTINHLSYTQTAMQMSRRSSPKNVIFRQLTCSDKALRHSPFASHRFIDSISFFINIYSVNIWRFLTNLFFHFLFFLYILSISYLSYFIANIVLSDRSPSQHKNRKTNCSIP